MNKYRPHVLVLPEDDANRQLANGFLLEVTRSRRMQVLPVAGGWAEVLRSFQSDHVGQMDRFPERRMILLIDFDNREDRLNEARAVIPHELNDRVFVLGVWSQPEDLRRANLRSYETIGKVMAEDCRAGTETIWGHDLLRHNAPELGRLRRHVQPILFG
jgi:hypothetical protein